MSKFFVSFVQSSSGNVWKLNGSENPRRPSGEGLIVAIFIEDEFVAVRYFDTREKEGIAYEPTTSLASIIKSASNGYE
jgi:hypothetical protein